MTDRPDTETPFNMAMLHYQEIHELRMIKTRAMLDNNLSLALECMEEMFTMVSFKLSYPEAKELNTLIREMKLRIPNFKVPTEVQQSIHSQIKADLRDIDRTIMIYMDRYKMIFPRIEMKDGLAKLNEKYKLK